MLRQARYYGKHIAPTKTNIHTFRRFLMLPKADFGAIELMPQSCAQWGCRGVAPGLHAKIFLLH